MKYDGQTIANLSCSLMKHYGVHPPNPSLGLADALLDRPYRNVVLLLLDGMGENIMHKHLPGDSFLMKHTVGIYSSVFPPTTVAATTSLLTGQYPNQHGRLGWTSYYPSIDRNVVVFFNTESGTGLPLPYPVVETDTPITTMLERIAGQGVEVHELATYLGDIPDIDSLCGRIETLCQQPARKFIYAYFNEPDHRMHEKGTEDSAVRDGLMHIDGRIAAMAQALSDTLLLVTADHGMVDTKGEVITDHPAVNECLLRPPSIEPRAVNLFVKPSMHAQFERAFAQAFGDAFVLMPRAQVLDSRLLGTGEDHPLLARMLGDYLALAVKDVSIFNSKEEKEFLLGVHAGLTQAELRIPLIACRS